MDIRFLAKVWCIVWAVIMAVLWCLILLAFCQSVVWEQEETVLGFVCHHFSPLLSTIINTILWFWFRWFCRREDLL